jgi:hypothetical protein
MATAGSDKSAEAEKPETPAHGRWRRRIPTPVVVTLIGIALSAWLLPAITRQWDDRQKAHDLQAAIVTDMASATARMLTRGELRNQHQRDKGLDRRQRIKVNRGVRSIEWSQASLQLEARLHAYFPDETVQAWQLYSYFVTYFDPTTYSSGREPVYEKAAEDVHPRDGPIRKQMRNLRILVSMVDPQRSDNDRVYQTLPDEEDLPGFRHLRNEVNTTGPRSPKLAVRAWKLSYLEKYLSALETAIADQVLATHPRGYSTTTGDLFRDLIP